MGLLSSIFEKRASISASNVNISNGGDPALVGMFGGGNVTNSSQTVNSSTAEKISTVFACVNRKAMTLAMIPLHTMRELQDGGFEIAKKHRTYKQLHAKPNAWQTSFEWRMMGQAHKMMRGNFYCYIQSTPGRGLNQLIPLHPDRVYPFIVTPNGVTYYMNDNSPTPPANSKVYYQYFGTGGGTEIFNSSEIFHLRGRSDNGIVGKNVVRLMAESVGLAMATEQQGATLFTNGAQISKVFKHPSTLDDVAFDRLRNQLDRYTGAGNAHKTIILENGMDISKLSLTMEEAQFLECVVPGTMLTMANGSLKVAEEIEVGDLVMGWKDGLLSAKVAAVGKPPLKRLLKITTSRGRSITVSEDHPFLSIPMLRTAGGRPYKKEASWVAANKLQIGSCVRVALGNVREGEETLTEHESYFLGAMTGDGYIRSKGCSFSSSYSEIVIKMNEAMHSLNGSLKKKSGENYDYELITNGSGCKGSEIRTLLNESGLVNCRSHEKRVPEIVMNAGPLAWANFLGGYFDTDGSIRPLNTKATPALYFSSVSKSLLEDCQHLLTLLDIQSVIYKMCNEGEKQILGKQSYAKDSYGLYVTDSNNLKKFANKIPVFHKIKNERLFDYKSLPESRYTESDYLYDKVISVEDMGFGQTIGIEIEGCHTHVTNGLITHNTRKFQVEDICSFLDVPMMLIHRSGDKNQTFASAEVVMQMFITLNMQPEFENWEQRLKADLLYESESDYYFNFDFDALMRGDSAARASYYQARLGTSSLTPNDIKRKEGESPYMNKPECDEVYLASGIMPTKLAGKKQEAVDKPETKVGSKSEDLVDDET